MDKDKIRIFLLNGQIYIGRLFNDESSVYTEVLKVTVTTLPAPNGQQMQMMGMVPLMFPFNTKLYDLAIPENGINHIDVTDDVTNADALIESYIATLEGIKEATQKIITPKKPSLII